MLGAWLVIFIAAAVAYPHLNINLSAPDYSVTGSDSAEVVQIIGSDFTAAGAEQDVIVFNSDDADWSPTPSSRRSWTTY